MKSVTVGQTVRVPLRKGTTIGTITKIAKGRAHVSYLSGFNLNSGFNRATKIIPLSQVEVVEK